MYLGIYVWAYDVRVYMCMSCVTVGQSLGVLLPSVRLSGVLLIESLEFCSEYCALSSVFAVAYALRPRAGTP